MIKIKHLTESLNRKYSIEKQSEKVNEEYSLVGQDGNAFSLMGYTARCMKECGLRDEIDEMRKLAMSGDYYNLIRVCDDYIQRCNEINPDLDESLNGNLQDTLDKIIDNYNYYKDRNNAGLLSIKEEGLKAFEEFSIKYPVFKKALQSKIKDDFKKDLVKSNIGLAIQSIGLLDESLNEEAQKEVFDKPGEFWYFTKHGIGPGSVPKDIDIEEIIEKDNGEYFLIKDKILSTYALNKYEIKEKSPDDVDEDWEKQKGNFAGWVAIYQGKKIEIPKDEANSLYDAKLKAIEKLKVPKSKVGLLVVQPGYNESFETNNKNVDDMSFDELLDLWWEMNGQWGPVDMEMEPDEIDAYFKENPDELKYNVEQGLKWYE